MSEQLCPTEPLMVTLVNNVATLLPISERVLLTPAPYFLVHSTAVSAQAPVFSAKPR